MVTALLLWCAALAVALDVAPRAAPAAPGRRRVLLGAPAALAAAGVPALVAPTEARAASLFDLEVPFKGKAVPLGKFRGAAHLVVNVKMDDPLAGPNFDALRYVANEYGPRGLRIWAFPTDQGYYEPDVSELIRAKAYQQFRFGSYPTAVVFDKIDARPPARHRRATRTATPGARAQVLANTAHPLYRALAGFKNPNGVGRLTLNFEKFLLDADGRPLRRYPRKFTAYDLEADVAAVLDAQPLAPETAAYRTAWVKADDELRRSEYAFRAQYNVWDQSEPSQDWTGLADLGFS